MRYGTRNSNLTTVMPTATCSIPLRNTESVEFPQSMLYAKKLLNGSYPILVRFMVFDLENIHTWNRYTCEYLKNNDGDLLGFDKFVLNNPKLYPEFKDSDLNRLQFLIQKYKPVWRISQKYLLQLNADRSRYIDMSHSQNIYMKESTVGKLQASHLYASKLGLKCLCYYLRQDSPQGNMKFTIDSVVKEAMSKCNITNIYDDNNKNENKPTDTTVELFDELFDEFEVCDPNNPDCLACQ
jgi:ribonucleotide reductase alpha subunit